MIRWFVLASALLFAAGCGGDEDAGGIGGAGGDLGVGGAGGDGSGGDPGAGGDPGTGGDSGAGGSGGDLGEGGGGGTICVPLTCEDLGANCGDVEDGCGGWITCGTCDDPETCGGGGDANVCGCTGETEAELCEEAGAVCGSITVTDSCGVERTVESCGSCADPETCGGGGEANVCGCTGETEADLCEEAEAVCGSITVTDSCGVERTVESCGTCDDPETCGGSGEANTCGCTGETDAQLCEEAGAVCGSITTIDSCGVERTVASCGACADPATCGGGGVANTCGCTGETDAQLCDAAGATCGSITATDSCGVERTIESCGSCADPETCGGSGEANVCGCTGETEAELCTLNGAECGALEVTDSCGVVRTVADCGTCTDPAICGAGGDPNLCGCTQEDDAALCARLHATCGPMEVVDLCGVVRTVASCGTCADGQACGGEGIPNTCGAASAWTQEHPATADDLHAVWGLGPASAWVAGAEGAVARFDGSSFVAHPTPTRAKILDLWAPDTTTAWAAGEDGTLLRFDGVFWRQVHTGFWDDFRSIAGLGPDEIQVLADDGSETFFVRWDGASWSRLEPGLLVDERLSRVRNVGGTLMATGTNGLVLTWDGQSWQRDISGAGTDLVALAGVGAEVWVAGERDVRRHDGTSWSSNLADNWLDSRYAIDLLGDLNTGKPWLLLGGTSVSEVVRHTSGSSWTTLLLPFNDANALHGSGTGDAWVVGAAGKVARWTGQAFELVSDEVPACTEITTVGTDAFALCDGAVWQRDAAGNWTELPASPRETLAAAAIWAGGPDDLWLLRSGSYQSSVQHWDGTTWTEMDNVWNARFDITGDANAIHVSGLGGRVYTWDRTAGTWSDRLSNAATSLFAMATHGGEIWVAGVNGYGAWFNGTSWSTRQSVLSARANAMDALDAQNVWAVGQAGAAARWNGTSWTEHGIPFSTADDLGLTDVWVEAADSVWAVAGASGNLFHWDGTAWTLVDASEHPSGLQALDALADGTKIAVGAGMASSP